MILSKNNGQFDLSVNVNSEMINEEEARNALISIAQELQRFHVGVEASPKTEDEDIFEKLHLCTTKMQSKNRHLKKLHRNLKMLCTVAKIVISAKNKERELLEDQLNTKRHECSDLLKARAENINLIEKLQAENATVYQEVDQVSNIIQLGYQEVQKLRHETPKDIPVLLGLKEILIACGQYYVDFCSEHERCNQLEQRNRFLKNKIVIMENDLMACKEEIRNLKNVNLRLTRSRETKTIIPLWLKGGTDVEPNAINNQISSQVEISTSQLNIASRLSAVRDLLCDQDKMLRDLRMLSNELIVSEF